MDWLDYPHLFYFWTVAREGSVTAACQRLLLSPPAISAQIRELEEALGEKVFNRSGRGLALTEAGRLQCVQDAPAQLLPPLAVHELDLVLSDAPVSPEIRVRACSHHAQIWAAGMHRAMIGKI